MKMVIHGRHLAITPAMREYAEEKIGRIKKYYENILEIDVTLSAIKSKTGPSHTVEALVFVNGATIKGSSTESDLYAAMDAVSDILETQVKKRKEKKNEEKYSNVIKELKVASKEGGLNKEISKTVLSTSLSPRPMSIEEAILQLECLKRSFYAFINAETREMNVVYHREDGDYGHIESGTKG
ncbi:MAG: ribosome hibernation-promoting factor, HPF/YfiA family [Fusobacteriaceae bacterium]